MDAKLGDTVAHRLNVAEKTSFKPLDPCDHNAANRGICQMVEPRGELRECFDAEHRGNVIVRLHFVKPAWPYRRERKFSSRVSACARGFVATNRPVGSTRKWPTV